MPLDSLHLILHGRALVKTRFKGIFANNGFRVMECLPEDYLHDSLHGVVQPCQ